MGITRTRKIPAYKYQKTILLLLLQMNRSTEHGRVIYILFVSQSKLLVILKRNVLDSTFTTNCNSKGTYHGILDWSNSLHVSIPNQSKLRKPFRIDI